MKGVGCLTPGHTTSVYTVMGDNYISPVTTIKIPV